MFNLDQAIAEWRRQMLAAGIKTPVPLEELESHLRDDVEQQVQSGLTAPRAFEAAIRQIGETVALKQEFNKIGTTERKQMKRIVAVMLALFSMVLGMSMILPQLGMWTRTGVLQSPTFLLLGVVLVISGGSAAFYGIRTRREARGRRPINIGIITAGSFYAMPLILAFFQTQKTDMTGWIFCALLAAASLLFFGSCFCLNRSLPGRSVRET